MGLGQHVDGSMCEWIHAFAEGWEGDCSSVLDHICELMLCIDPVSVFQAVGLKIGCHCIKEVR